MSGKDINGSSFTGYSKEYKESLEFQAYGKTNKVNMELTGQMLGTIDVLDTSGDEIEIGWDDTEENAKAFNHIEGDTVPVRDFFGITESEFKDNILPKYEDEINRSDSEILSQRARDLFRDLSAIEITEAQLGGFFLGEEEEGF